jgi:CRISPR-associated protein (TIGR03986 family)
MIVPPRDAQATKAADVLTAVTSHSLNAAASKLRRYRRQQWDDALAAWFDSAADGDTVDVVVHVDNDGQGRLTMKGRAPITAVPAVAGLAEALDRDDGFVNPYTFVPTPPRGDLARAVGDPQPGPGPTGLGDSGPDGPPSHARYTADQWAGCVRVTLTTLTPLVLPDPQSVTPDGDGRKTFDVRLGEDGRPLITGTSVKGALRSAYETITASRYGVFRGHDMPPAYRIPAGAALELQPARIERAEDGGKAVWLCAGDADWHRTTAPGNEVQAAAWVPAYRSAQGDLRRVGRLKGGPLSRLHGKRLTARARLYQYQNNRGTRFQVWRVTHLATSKAELRAELDKQKWAESKDPSHPLASLTLIAGVPAAIVDGWLSVGGRSIESKHDERFFVRTPTDQTLELRENAVQFWRHVLRAYDQAAEYSELAAGLERSRHVKSISELLDLPVGTLLYARLAGQSTEAQVTELHPVMIGRQPFSTAPETLLDASLRPASALCELSPADRVFGWVPAEADRQGGARLSSGYRGRLAVRKVRCLTDDWAPADFPADSAESGVVLAPLSTPKPTQFRFYAAPDPSGVPMPKGTDKDHGYAASGGLRGRKVYRWRQEQPEYWQPPASTREPADPREYLAPSKALSRAAGQKEAADNVKQSARHRRWVRRDVEFEVTLFLDGVPTAELGALLWLLGLGDRAPLRLGAGKPLGFGVLRCDIDWDHTRLWDGRGLAAGWRSLTRPPSADPVALQYLAAEFERTAMGHPVLAEAVQSFLAASAPVQHPVHYPWRTPEPNPKSYEWFVRNEKVSDKTIIDGWALPHVRDREQRLPYFPAEEAATRAGASGQTRRRGRSRPRSR